MAIKDYSTEPDMNTTISGINIAEGCAPSGINNAIRQLMADVKAEKEAQAAKESAQDTAINGKLDKSGGIMTGQVRFSGAPTTSDSPAAVFPGRYRGVITKLTGEVDYADWHVQNKNGNPIGNFRFTDAADYINMEISVQASEEGVSWPGAIDMRFDKATKKFTAKVSGNDILTSAGGTMTKGAVIYASEGIIQGIDNTGTIWISGGKGSNGNPYIQLFAGSRTSHAGRIDISAKNADGSSNQTLSLNPVSGNTSLNGKPVITLVDSWSDGNGNWYRKYNDGWIEQGGVATIYASVTFGIPFSNTNYTILLTKKEYGANAWPVNVLKDSQKTTGFTTDAYAMASSNTIYWYACGY